MLWNYFACKWIQLEDFTWMLLNSELVEWSSCNRVLHLEITWNVHYPRRQFASWRVSWMQSCLKFHTLHSTELRCLSVFFLLFYRLYMDNSSRMRLICICLCRCRWFSQTNYDEYRLLAEYTGLVDCGSRGSHQVWNPSTYPWPFLTF